MTQFNPDQEWVERSAKLFEAGEYPDKGLAVSPVQVAALAEAFQSPVPLLIEHAESPLELGFLTEVQAIGSELFGTIKLSPQANSLVESSGARSLSLGLSPALDQIREVSLVRNPRVASAQMFSECVVFEGELGDSCLLSGKSLHECASQVFAEGEQANWKQRYEQLAAETEEKDAEQLVNSYIKEGRLTPAQAQYAKTLLKARQNVHFDGRSRPVAQIVKAMIESQPTLKLFEEIVPEQPAKDFSSQLLLPEEAEFYRRHFPDVSLDLIARKRA